ncbi:sulfotransferase [Pseudomonadales bacterium]|nr:sulfotransferase [Pseudomonadales bacterium]
MKFLFVCGASRSGTTLIARCLSKHTRVESTPELHLFNLVVPHLASIDRLNEININLCLDYIYLHGFLEFKKNLGSMSWSDGSMCLDLGPALAGYFKDKNPSCEVVCEQTGMNLYAQESINRYIKSPLYLIMRRDIKAILASQKYRYKLIQNDGGSLSKEDYFRIFFSRSVILQLLLFRKTRKEMLLLSRESNAFTIQYESLLRNPREVIASLCQFIDLPCEESMLKVNREGSSHDKFSSADEYLNAENLSLQFSEKLGHSAVWLAQKCYPDFVLSNESVNPSILGGLLLLIEFLVFTPFALLLSMRSYGSVFSWMKARF